MLIARVGLLHTDGAGLLFMVVSVITHFWVITQIHLLSAKIKNKIK